MLKMNNKHFVYKIILIWLRLEVNSHYFQKAGTTLLSFPLKPDFRCI